LLLGDLPWAEQVELDSPYDVRDAGLARFSGKPVTGSNPGLCAPAEGGPLCMPAPAWSAASGAAWITHCSGGLMSRFRLFRWGRIISRGHGCRLGHHGGIPLGSLPGLAARLCPVPWLPFSPARSRAPVACVAVAGPLGVARAGRGSPRVAPGL